MAMETFGTGQGFLKAGFLGFPKSGKTFTAAKLAVALRKRIGSKKPVAFFDTEAGVEYVAPILRKETGAYPIGKRSRAMADLMTLAKQCEGGEADILIVDSITHVWREVCKAYLKQVNEARERANRPARQRLEFQDWANIKDKWNLWTDFYLNSQLHIIICGRAGYEYDFEDHEDASGQTHKELVKTGIKMKVEGEFGYEPSLLVQMILVSVSDANQPNGFRQVHRAQVLGDRFDAMDGATCDNPGGDFFAPHLDLLIPGATNVVDTEIKTDMEVDESGDGKFIRERKDRTILLEQIQAEIVQAFPGQSAAEKRSKVKILDECCGTKSWTAVESFGAEQLAMSLAAIQDWVRRNLQTAGDKEE